MSKSEKGTIEELIENVKQNQHLERAGLNLHHPSLRAKRGNPDCLLLRRLFRRSAPPNNDGVADLTQATLERDVVIFTHPDRHESRAG